MDHRDALIEQIVAVSDFPLLFGKIVERRTIPVAPFRWKKHQPWWRRIWGWIGFRKPRPLPTVYTVEYQLGPPIACEQIPYSALRYIRHVFAAREDAAIFRGDGRTDTWIESD